MTINDDSNMSNKSTSADEFQLGDKVRYKSAKFKGIVLEVCGVNRDRYEVRRMDANGNAWFRRAGSDELERVT